ncbi:MAG: D-glucuronyl C5-epimerase family protein [Micrococcales bacterium]|nr:D-glucuronyl C5-epimerase family protein [Micrococcales bacterium]
MNKRIRTSLSIGLILALLVAGAGVYYFNSKLNKSHRAVLDQVTANQNKVIESQKQLAEELEALVNEMNIDPPYEFPSRPNSTARPYNPRKMYLSATSENPISDNKDKDGVALIYREEADGNSYHPVAIARYGLGMFSNFIGTGDQVFFDEARIQADYFVRTIDPDTGLFYYDFDFYVHNHQLLKAPWSSAMAQGLVLSLLARMYDQTGDQKYLETCKLAMKPLALPVANGGLQAQFFGGHPFYEEYPTELPSFTLNGFMFTLIGLLDFWEITGDPTAKELYDQGIETLEYALPFYDINGISLYKLSHLNGFMAPPQFIPMYHMLHIRQLQLLNQWEDSEIMQYYIQAWSDYANPGEPKGPEAD